MNDLRAQLRRQLRGALRHRWLALALAWAVCAAGWAVSAAIPDVYEASARLYVDADAVLTPLLRGLALDDAVSSQLEVMQRTLLSRPNLEKLVSKTDLQLSVNGPADLEREVARLQSEVKVVAQTRNLFTITYRSHTPKLAFDVVNAVLDIFVETSAGDNRSDMQNAQHFLDQQIDDYEQQLHEAERRRADFKAKYLSLLPSDATGVTGLDQARASVVQLQGALADARDKRARLQQELAKTPQVLVTEVDPGTSGGGGDPDIEEAERKLQELSVNDTDAHPDVVEQRRLLAALRRSGGRGAAPGRPARSHSVPNEVYTQLTLEAVNADETAASLQRQVADATRERDRLEEVARTAPGLQAQFVALNRDYDVIRRNYDELIGRRESMRISAAADQQADKVHLRIVDPPQIPRVTVGPKRALMFTAVLLAGLAAGAGGAMLLAQLDRSFHTSSDLGALGLPVAGAISMLGRVRRRAGFAALRTAALCFGLLLLCFVYGGLMVRVLRAGGVA